MTEAKTIKMVEAKDAGTVAVAAFSILGIGQALYESMVNGAAIQGLQNQLNALAAELDAARSEYRGFFSDMTFARAYADIQSVTTTLALWEGTADEGRVSDAWPNANANYNFLLTMMLNAPGFLSDEDLVRISALHDVTLAQQSAILAILGKSYPNANELLGNIPKVQAATEAAQIRLFTEFHRGCEGEVTGGHDGEPIMSEVGYLNDDRACEFVGVAVGYHMRDYAYSMRATRALRDGIVAELALKKTEAARRDVDTFYEQTIQTVRASMALG